MDRLRRRILLRSLQALVQPPADALQFIHLVYIVLSILYGRPPNPQADIRIRMFSGLNYNYLGRNVFESIAEQRYTFFEVTGETPETFIQLVNILNLNVRRPHSLSVINRILLVIVWLRSYPCFTLLSSIFNVSVTTVNDEIHFILPILLQRLNFYMTWPTINEWRDLRNNWPEIPMAVGAIDGTSHEIYRPMTEPQQMYYSGHRNYHAITRKLS